MKHSFTVTLADGSQRTIAWGDVKKVISYRKVRDGAMGAIVLMSDEIVRIRMQGSQFAQWMRNTEDMYPEDGLILPDLEKAV